MFLTLCLAGSLLVQTPSGASSSPWRTFASPKGGYTVSLPGEAVEDEKEVVSPNGKQVPVRTMICDAEGVRYSIVRVPLPVVIGFDERTKFFKGNIDGMVKRDKGKLVAEKAITDVGQPCHEVTYVAPRDDGRVTMLVRTRMYIFGGNYYTQTITGPKDAFPASAATQYFQSFRFGGGQDTTKANTKPGPPTVKSRPSGPDR